MKIFFFLLIIFLYTIRQNFIICCKKKKKKSVFDVGRPLSSEIAKFQLRLLDCVLH